MCFEVSQVGKVTLEKGVAGRVLFLHRQMGQDGQIGNKLSCLKEWQGVQ